MKSTTRCGADVVEELNDVLLAEAVEARRVRMHKVRVDTTVVEADVAYPTDSGLLAKAIARIAKTVSKIQAAGWATRTRTRDRSRSAGGGGPGRSQPSQAPFRRGQGAGQGHQRGAC